MKTRSVRIIFAVAAFLSLSAFRHTDIEGYTDPNYMDYKFRSVVVQFPNSSLVFKKHAITQLERRFKKFKIRIYQHDELFAPTREWTEEASAAIYEQFGIDAGRSVVQRINRLRDAGYFTQ